jgi:hypothetical protein
VSQSVPIIFTPPAAVPNLTLLQRAIWLAVSTACLSVMIVAASIQPDPSGESTHAQLGLNSCQFLARTGIPCPSCGMTTSFAWFVRGNLLASFYVQPMGLALAVIVSLTFWLALYMAISAKPAWRLVAMIPAKYWLIPAMALAVFSWGWKIFIHLRGIDGWR